MKRRGDHAAGKRLQQAAQLAADVDHLARGDGVLIALALLRREVVGHGLGAEPLALRLAVVREREVGAEHERVARAFEPAKRRLRVAHLLDREGRRDFVRPAGLDLRGSDFERGLLGARFLLGLEVAPNADAAEPAVNAPRRGAVAILEASNEEL